MKHQDVIFLFSGQGSQYLKMGTKLFQVDEYYRAYAKQVNSIFIKNYQIDILSFLNSESNAFGESFNDLKYSHPAIFMVGYSIGKSLIKHGIHPQYLLGTKFRRIYCLSRFGYPKFGTKCRFNL